MNNGWLDGVPRHPLPYVGASFIPVANVEHRTIGRWAGDFAVLSRGRVPSVHFLIGEEIGQWVQFYSILKTCAHAAGANGYAVGIEFSGQNAARLNAWQLYAGGEIHRQLIEFGIKPTFLANGKGRVGYWQGFLNHSNVATEPKYTHFDFIYEDEFQRMVDDMLTKDQAWQLGLTSVLVGDMYNLKPGSPLVDKLLELDREVEAVQAPQPNDATLAKLAERVAAKIDPDVIAEKVAAKLAERLAE